MGRGVMATRDVRKSFHSEYLAVTDIHLDLIRWANVSHLIGETGENSNNMTEAELEYLRDGIEISKDHIKELERLISVLKTRQRAIQE